MMKHIPFHAHVDTNTMQHYQVHVLSMFMFSAMHIYMQFVTALINNAAA